MKNESTNFNNLINNNSKILLLPFESKISQDLNVSSCIFGYIHYNSSSSSISNSSSNYSSKTKTKSKNILYCSTSKSLFYYSLYYKENLLYAKIYSLDLNNGGYSKWTIRKHYKHY